MIKMMKAVIRKLIMIKLKKIKMKIFLILLKLLLLQKASNQKLRFYQTMLAWYNKKLKATKKQYMKFLTKILMRIKIINPNKSIQRANCLQARILRNNQIVKFQARNLNSPVPPKKVK